MEFHSSLAESHDLTEACDAVASDLRRRLGDAAPDVMIVFASAAYGDALDRLPVLLHERVGAPVLVGGTGAAQIDTTYMSEQTPALVALAGRAPGAEFAARAVSEPDLPHADAPPADWRRLLPETAGTIRGLVVLGEPAHFDPRPLLEGLDFVLPDVPKVGGLASGSRHPYGNALFCGRERVNQGAVLLAIAGDVTVTPVVSQGCRPIGRAGAISKAAGNRLAAVDGVPAKRFVEQQLQDLGREELALAENNPLFLGIASDPFTVAPPGAGDFLVRNVLGIDDDDQLVVGESLSVGRAVQLHLRDGDGGLEDLETRLGQANAHAASAALMFRCVGRQGQDHGVVQAVAPDIAMAGCTCNGEIGPVGAVTHMHAYTASCLLLAEGAST
ncbi:MAG: FIST N-terminal domain-containing protein [Planctomycetota bacterium]|nr:FIST N-terminal domain-containing protein [Planctomycetota bacterium]